MSKNLSQITENILHDLKNGGNKELADSLRNFTEAVMKDIEINDEIKNSILENLAFLSAQANLPKENRQKGIIRSVLHGLKDLIVSSAALLSLWTNLQPLLQNIF